MLIIDYQFNMFGKQESILYFCGNFKKQIIMKKSFLLLAFLFTLFSYGQAASKVNNAQNIPTNISDPSVILGCDALPSGLFRVYVKDSIKWETYNINNFTNSIQSIGDSRYKPISYTPSNSEITTGLGYTPYNSTNPSNYISTEVDPTVGSHIKAISTTNISDWNTAFSWGNHASFGYLTPTSTATLTNKSGNISMWSNDSGYITGITNGMVTTALGYSPYNGTTNPNGYISSYTETDPIWNSDKINYKTKTQNDLLYQPIGSYLTSEVDPTVPSYSKSLTGFSAIQSSTDALYEPIFSKNTAFNKNFGSASNTVAEGNDSRILNGQTAFSWGNHTSAGYFLSSNFNSSFDTRFSLKTTTDLTEGSNLYFTNSRSRSAISLTTIGSSGASSYNSSTGILNVPTYTLSGLGGISLSSLSATSPLSYNNGTGAFSIQQANTSQAGYLSNTDWNTFNNKQNTISLTTTGTSGVATLVGNTLNIPNYDVYVAPTINNNVSRSLNSNFTISTTKQARVYYSINVAWSITALVSTSSSAFLEYSTNGGSSWITVSQVSKNVNLGLVQSGADDLNLSGEIPANALVRIRTTSSNSTITFVRAQEVY